MPSLMQKIIHSIDSYLWRYGFRIENIRLTLRALVLFNIIALLISIILLPFTKFPLAFSLASILSTLNFFAMAKNILANFPNGGTSKVTSATLFSSFIRLFALIALSFIGILILQLPIFAWLLGLGIPIIFLPIIFMTAK